MADTSLTMFYMKLLYLCVFVIFYLAGNTQSARPVLNNLPSDEYIGELETSERLVEILNVTELSNLAYTCTVSAITGSLSGSAVATNGDEFETKYDSTHQRYELWTTAAGVAVYDSTVIDEYQVDVECTNSIGETSNGNFDHFNINVINDRLIFSTLPTSVSKSAAITATTTIYTETVTDDSGSTSDITCSLKYASVTGFFDVNPGTCAVYTIADLIGIDASSPSVTLMIGAQDSVTKITTYDTLTVLLSNQNTKPTTNTNGAAVSQSWSESTAVGTVLHAVTVSDPDSGQTHTYSMDCIPTSGDSFIDINANGEIEVISALDYETANYFDCNYYINDGTHTGGPFRYEITVTNVNDAPTFVSATYYLTIPEGAAGTLPTSNPTLSCTDEDTGDTQSYGFVTSTYSQYFNVDNTGQFELAQSYNIDNSANPTALVLEIVCVDGSTVDGTTKTGTATLSVTITDINDNAPTFSPATYTIYVDQYTTAGTVIGTYYPSDPDSGVFGQYTCTATSASSYGTVYSVLSDCSVILNTQTKPFSDGTTVQYTVTATDKGTPALSGTGVINVVYRETSTTTLTTTTTTDYNFFNHPENIAIFVLLLLFGLALLGLLTWCLCAMCNGGNMCDCGMRSRRYPKRRAITPEEKTPPRPRRTYTPEQRKVTVIRERPALPTVYRPPPYYAPPGRYPGPVVPPGGTFPTSPFVPYR